MSENRSEVDQAAAIQSPNGGIHPIDFNTAELEQLIQVPGVGPKIAERIVASRPFDTLGDIQRVSGIGPSVFERIKPFVSLGSDNSRPGEVVAEDQEEELAELLEDRLEVEDDAELAEIAGDELSELDATTEPADLDIEAPRSDDELEDALLGTMDFEAEDAEEADVPEFAEPLMPDTVPAAPPAGMTRGQTFWLVVGSSFVAFALALVLSLAILAGINNGGLQFALPGEVTNLNVRLDGLLDQAQVLQSDLNGLRARMDNLETLGGRVDNVEAATTELGRELEATGQQITTLNEEAAALGQQIGAVGEQVSALEGENEQFRTFFGGLQELLNQVFAPAEAP